MGQDSLYRPLHEKCPNTELLFSRILTEYGEILSPNAGKYGPEKTSYLDTFHEVKLLFEFFSHAVTFFANSVDKHCFKSTKYQNELYLKCF